MPRNGSGVYSVYTPGNPVVAGTTIDPTAFNNTTNDLATALTNSIASNGETPVTANLPMAGFKHTGAGTATATGQYMTYGQAGNFTSVVMAGALSGVTTLSMAGALSGVTTLTMSGALTGLTTATDSSGNDLGYKGLPQVTSYTGNTNNGKIINATAGFTVNVSDGVAAGVTFSVYNNSSSAITITAGVGGGAMTLRLAGTTTTGNRTLAARGLCSIYFLSSSEAILGGAGLT